MIRRTVLSYIQLQNGALSIKNIFKYPNIVNTQLAISKYSTLGKESIQNLTQNNTSESHLPENEFLVKIKNDPDSFGYQYTKEEFDDDDLKEEEYLKEKPLPSQRLRTKQYADIIKKLLRKRKLQEAIDVLEIRMLKEDRVKPEGYIYSLLIGGCGRVGYTKKAFSLFNNLKKRGLTVHPGMYTALFNACANSPWPETDGLTRAKHLRNLMIEKLYEPNESNYNAMIKAFGRCGDIITAFEIVDEMSAKKFPIKADTLNFLLQACITNKEAGFRHALLVWRKFIENNINPDIFTFNLMLRCIRDCEIGDLEVTKDAIEQLVGEAPKLESSNKLKYLESGVQDGIEMLRLDTTDSDTKDGRKDSNAQELCCGSNNENLATYVPEMRENRPNLMAEKPHLGNIISLSEIKKPQDRLLLAGGLLGFLETIVHYNCKPDIKTFTQLLDTIPGTAAAEKELLQNMKKFNIKPDIDFFNMLIKRRSLRFEYESAREVLGMINTAKLRPDLITYGVLALGCKTKEEALQLIEEMKSAKYRLNPEILGAMLHQACYHNNFYYVLELMEICIKEEVPPNKKFMTTLEEFKKKSKVISNDRNNPLSNSKKYQEGYKKFKMRYKKWLEEINFQEEEVHPWQQYRQPVETNVKYYKDKEQATRFKPKLASRYRQKTSVKAK